MNVPYYNACLYVKTRLSFHPACFNTSGHRTVTGSRMGLNPSRSNGTAKPPREYPLFPLSQSRHESHALGPVPIAVPQHAGGAPLLDVPS